MGVWSGVAEGSGGRWWGRGVRVREPPVKPSGEVASGIRRRALSSVPSASPAHSCGPLGPWLERPPLRTQGLITDFHPGRGPRRTGTESEGKGPPLSVQSRGPGRLRGGCDAPPSGLGPLPGTVGPLRVSVSRRWHRTRPCTPGTPAWGCSSLRRLATSSSTGPGSVRKPCPSTG